MSRFEGPRGLIGYARIETAEQQTVEVQQSSAVMAGTTNGPVYGPFVWLRVERSEVGSFAHLTVNDAREVRDALSAWLADFGGEQETREPSEPVRVQIAGRRGGKHSALADMIVERANARGVRVEFVEPDREPSDAEACLVCERTGGTHKMSCRPQNRADAERYPSDAEVEAAADAIIEASFGQELPEAPADLARAALLAAQEVRRG